MRSEPVAAKGCSPSPPWPARERDRVRKTSDVLSPILHTHQFTGRGQHLISPPLGAACNGARHHLPRQMGEGRNVDFILNAGWE